MHERTFPDNRGQRGFAWRLRPRFNNAMPTLTRRRCPEAREECWHIYFGDFQSEAIGTAHTISSVSRRSFRLSLMK
jgi:hypothetical protein